MTKKNNEETNIISSSLPTAFSDQINIAKRSDDIVLLQFTADLPGAVVENFRTMMKTDSAKTFIEDLASMLDYYPLKPEPKKKTNSLKLKSTTK